MIKELLLSLCISLSFCFINLETHLIKNFTYTGSTSINSEFTNKGNIISPISTWVKILSSESACLFYKVPFKENLGALALVKNQRSCSFDDEVILKKRNIKSLSISKTNDKFSSNNLTIEMIITTDIDRQVITVPLLMNTIKKVNSKYSNNVDTYYFDSVTFENTFKVNKLKNGISCHAVNSSCVSVTENNCSLCENGFHEVVDYNCPQGGSKYCGIIKCGQKGSPACPRGYEILDSKLASLCFDGSPAGYCAPGLKTYCNEEKILICL